MSIDRPADWPMLGTPQRISGIAVNQICDIADLAREDPSVIKLWIGEGDLPTPDFIREAAFRAVEAGHTRYTYSLGIPALRQALDAYHRRHWGVDLGPDRFTVTAGGVQAIMQACQAVLEPGDEVIVPVPAWPNLLEIVRIVGGTVVPVPYRSAETGGFRLDLDDLFAAVTPRTKIIAINSPSNPTGWVMPRDQVRAVLDFARARGIWIVSDEVYAHFTYDTHSAGMLRSDATQASAHRAAAAVAADAGPGPKRRPPHDGKLAPSFLEFAEPTDRLIVTNTFSKNWCMTGWRVGWLIYPQGMAPVFDNLSQYNTTGVATFIQHAAVAALNQGDDFIKSLVARSARGREIICTALDRLPNVRVFWPEGTFYFFFAVHGMNNGQDVARRILRQAHVGVAPGSAFGPGGEAYLRVCFAVDPALIQDAADRLVQFLGPQE